MNFSFIVMAQAMKFLSLFSFSDDCLKEGKIIERFSLLEKEFHEIALQLEVLIFPPSCIWTFILFMKSLQN